jgi:transcriptional antiterminator RfaH
MSYWTVAQTESQRERTASVFLAQNGFETYLPRIKKRKLVEPLFPGYIFIRIERHWHTINTTIGILRILLAGECPAMLRNEVVDEIRAREDRRGFIRLPKPTHKRGAKVRITRGTFTDHLGIYDGASRKDRERVLLAILGRMVPVEVAPADLEFTT